MCLLTWLGGGATSGRAHPSPLPTSPGPPHPPHSAPPCPRAPSPRMRAHSWLQWWEFKAAHFDAVLLFKMGKFYELMEMDAHTGVEVLGLSYMKVGGGGAPGGAGQRGVASLPGPRPHPTTPSGEAMAPLRRPAPPSPAATPATN